MRVPLRAIRPLNAKTADDAGTAFKAARTVLKPGQLVIFSRTQAGKEEGYGDWNLSF